MAKGVGFAVIEATPDEVELEKMELTLEVEEDELEKMELVLEVELEKTERVLEVEEVELELVTFGTPTIASILTPNPSSQHVELKVPPQHQLPSEH